ncbi:MAG: tRNA preQ1(34) S-adenosylmethionine ribosyltransferase-isomerase QueA [Anaerolineae bacterium]|nr:tRNA preQ1(34) S-adenosylmethionine ribosyltransferase-isomerase QueA [Anaerolineales bacterium]MCQ3974669.1 tRNA preQ1(34) S-adenosylmethionine ribosyltransferase-isomerase QueA [Anaerolineae bacterium]
MNINQFDYPLPPELIAQTPIEPRHASRLMIVDSRSGQISHRTFADLPDLLLPGDILVANDSRVIPARLFGRKTSGGRVEILLLKRVDDLRWEALVGGKRVRPGVVVEIEEARRRGKEDEEFVASSPPRLLASVIEDLGDSRRLIEFNQPVDSLLAEIGHTPLPPYIHTTLADAERYQTVYSRVEGSAAAPTAGLHFSPEMLLALREKGVLLDYVTLHIGLDTFKPVTVEQVERHTIHREFARLTPETARRINEAKLAGGRLVAVGTTAARTLETAALRSAGVTGSLQEASTLDPQLCPWKPVAAIEEETDLFIYPGYTFRAVDILLTNFHLPKSTLLMLVGAFAGVDLIRRAYEAAVAEKYRFYSFGDAMLILR